jgi:3-phenylpropionate/trans-cinnamate dioxygenase ferredoxin reductase subunit
MKANRSIVIVGAGHAGVQAAASLRDEGVVEPIVLVSGENTLPYERPPLSKKFLEGSVDEQGILLRNGTFYQEKNIELISGKQVVSVDRASQRVKIDGSSPLSYSHLVFATGCGKRKLDLEINGIEGVLGLRTLADASELRDSLDHARTVVVIGAGFIGMEFAAIAAKRGCEVDIVESAPRPLGRSATKVASDYLRAVCEKRGIRFHFNSSVNSIDHAGGRVKGVHLFDRYLPADIVLIGVGAQPRDRIAAESGLPCPNGIEVDESLNTPDPNVSAVGDCTWHPNPHAGRMIRLECVQNAQDQARIVAKKIAGKAARYDAVPAFWSDIGESRLQVAGLLDQCDRHIVRGSVEEGKFSVFGFRDGILKGVESVNRPADNVLARKVLASHVVVRPDQVEQETFELKQVLARPVEGVR